MPYIETFNEFSLRQNCDHCDDGGKVRFVNGAIWECMPLLGGGREGWHDQRGQGIEPTDEMPEQARRMVKYYERKIAIGEAEFTALDAHINQQLHFAERSPLYCPPPDPSALEVLKEISRVVKRFRRRLREWQAQLPVEDNNPITHHEKAKAKTRKRTSELAQEFKKITC